MSGDGSNDHDAQASILIYTLRTERTFRNDALFALTPVQ